MTLPAYPNQFPALTLDFVNSKKLDPRFTFERASAASPDSSAMVNGEVQQFGIDVPRLSDKGLLIEESRANYQINSEAFAVNAAWRIKDDYTRGPNTTEPAPDGSNTACEFFEVTGGGILNGVESASMYQVTAASGRLTISVYNKPINCDTFNIMPSTTTSAVANCTSIVNNTWQFNTNFVESAKAEPIGNGWYRMSATMIVPTSAQWYRPLFSSQMFGGPTDTPDSSQGCTLWGAQVEEGDFVSSYIPNTATSTTTVTRAADVCVFNDSNAFGSSSGTFIVDATLFSTNFQNEYVFIASAATSNTSVSITAGPNYSFQVYDSVYSGLVNYPAYTSGVRVTTAGAYAPGTSGSSSADVAFASDGAIRGTNTATGGSAVPTGMYQMYLFRTNSGATSSLATGHLHRLAFYPARASNAELEVLTA